MNNQPQESLVNEPRQPCAYCSNVGIRNTMWQQDGEWFCDLIHANMKAILSEGFNQYPLTKDDSLSS